MPFVLISSHWSRPVNGGVPVPAGHTRVPPPGRKSGTGCPCTHMWLITSLTDDNGAAVWSEMCQFTLFVKVELYLALILKVGESGVRWSTFYLCCLGVQRKWHRNKMKKLMLSILGCPLSNKMIRMLLWQSWPKEWLIQNFKSAPLVLLSPGQVSVSHIFPCGGVGLYSNDLFYCTLLSIIARQNRLVPTKCDVTWPNMSEVT